MDRNVGAVGGRLDGRHLHARGHVPAVGALRPFGRSAGLLVSVDLRVDRFVVGQGAAAIKKKKSNYILFFLFPPPPFRQATKRGRVDMNDLRYARRSHGEKKNQIDHTHCVEPVLLAL